ncbi:MAG: helix-turn-helix domain-containing protein [Candidatus Hodarchaeales archaeon]|jgi:sugar-specific transcriptional regulator TrmB
MSLGLESLNLDDQESKLYIILLANGPQSLGELIQNTEFPSADITKALEGLKKKDYAFDIPGIATRYHAILPFKDLKTAGEATIAEMEALASQIGEHVAKKMETIISTMRTESDRMKEGIDNAQSAVNKYETQSQTEIEELTAKLVLEIEQANEENKKVIDETISQQQTEHQELISGIGTTFEQKAGEFQNKSQETNTALENKYSDGLDSLKTTETERNTNLRESVENLSKGTSDKFSQGFVEVQTSMKNANDIVISSIDKQEEYVTNFISDATSKISNVVTSTSSEGKQAIESSLQTYQENLKQNLDLKKEAAVELFQSSRDQFTSKTSDNTQGIQNSIGEILNSAQNQINEMVQKIHDSLNEKIIAAKSEVDNSMGTYSDSLKQQVESDFEKVISDTTGTLADLVTNANSTYEKVVTEIDSHYAQFELNSNTQINTFKESSIKDLNEAVSSLKTDVQKQISDFSETMKPHELFLQDELKRFSSEFADGQTQSLTKFSETIDSFKIEVTNKNQELSSLIQSEMSQLKQTIKQGVSEMNSLVASYDEKYGNTLTDAATKASESLISKTRDLQEKTVATINHMSKSAVQQLGGVNQVISNGIQTEITTLEKELGEYSAKFQDVTKKNDEAMKNYLFSLEKLTSLVTGTKHPQIQTVPIISKEANLTFIEGMFNRLKGGITLLIPSVDDIPVDLILATKNHQRVNLVTMIDRDKHIDLLKKLLQKPNVRVRQIDPHKFEGIEGYLAADRDAEEVLIGIKEDNGETIGIASQADTFIVLMGKIVLGDYFLARSTEINRTEVGV